MAKTIQVTLTKSVIGASPKQRQTIQALGLRKLNDTVECANNESVQGMLNKVSHLVTVQDN